MLAVIAATLLATKANNTSTTTSTTLATCLYTSLQQQNINRNIIASAMQHLHCKQQTLKKSQLYCQKRMCFGRWHHCIVNILQNFSNICLQNRMFMSVTHQIDKISNNNISIKRIKRLNNNNNNKRNGGSVTHRLDSGGLSMKLYLASSMFNDKMMYGKLRIKTKTN